MYILYSVYVFYMYIVFIYMNACDVQSYCVCVCVCEDVREGMMERKKDPFTW